MNQSTRPKKKSKEEANAAAMAELLAKKFGVESFFIDAETGL